MGDRLRCIAQVAHHRVIRRWPKTSAAPLRVYVRTKRQLGPMSPRGYARHVPSSEPRPRRSAPPVVATVGNRSILKLVALRSHTLVRAATTPRQAPPDRFEQVKPSPVHGRASTLDGGMIDPDRWCPLHPIPYFTHSPLCRTVPVRVVLYHTTVHDQALALHRSTETSPALLQGQPTAARHVADHDRLEARRAFFSLLFFFSFPAAGTHAC